jgi:hypothetical protein
MTLLESPNGVRHLFERNVYHWVPGAIYSYPIWLA